ncbi:SusC/RagA family TonB-linked outer membrane protein [Olivibacter domesticus]|uniref:TonB-linked outer membrane protein, SusC/RagA family n=1 Tax=Olivibacter domesticus TaxID=407022 RepID=A0A1H7KJJ8_OLID1|nr:SusC/RagA family TonB-linked outer membrane protein [Olivibacter domesticus]SEK86686.1 TonB-linked outer membrane protein, SusC/RagA family [Olivibacter domesticus]
MLKYILIFMYLCCVLTASAQKTLALKGFVIGQSNEPIAGVTVLIKGLKQQAQTDNNGYFSWSLPISDTAELVVSKVGYKSEIVLITVNTVFPLSIKLTDHFTVLEEVVVSTGYTSVPKDRATGSFSVIDKELFNRQISTDVITRLDGLAPGILFDKRGGERQNFQIRGISTLYSNARPLIILDNFPYEGDINNINPNDIESVTFLKDAAAASIWGARAGNGVLVITTKKAKFNAPMQLNVTSNLTIQDKSDLFYMPLVSSSDYIDIERFLFEQGAYDAILSNTADRPVITPVVELLDDVRAGRLEEGRADILINSYRDKDIRKDYERYLYRPAFLQQHALQLSGGNDHHNYRLSFGYDKNLTELKENENDRLTIRAQNKFKPLKQLEIELGFVYTASRQQDNNPGSVRMGLTDLIYPYAKLADDNGTALPLEQEYRKRYLDTAGSGKLLDWQYFPLNEIYEADNRIRTNDLLLNANVTYRINDDLKVAALYQYENQGVLNRGFKSEEMFFTRNLINKFTTVDGNNIKRNVPLGGILDLNRQQLYSHALRLQLDYNKTWKDVHQLTALGGTEVRDALSDSEVSRTYGYNDQLMTGGVVDLLTRFPVFGGLEWDQQIPNLQSFGAYRDRFLSLYANASYSFKSKYIFSGSARRDASNLFGTSTNNKWKPLWSAGFKYRLAEEAFFPSQLVPKFDLSITYGKSGNVNNGITALTTIRYQSSPSPLANLPFAFVQGAPNQELRWENVSQLNTEINFALKNNRIDGSVAYYRKKATDLISGVAADPTTGFSSLTMNAASLLTTGLDVQVNTLNMTNKSFSWATNWIFSRNKDKVLENYVSNLGSSNYVTGSRIPPGNSYPLNSLFSYAWAGLDAANGDPQGYLDGQLSKDYQAILQSPNIDNLVFHGTQLPRIFGAIRNNVRWGNFSLSVNVTYRFDYYFRRPTISYSSLLSSNASMPHADYYKRWQQAGDEVHTSVPSLAYPASANRDRFYINSEVLVEKGDHIRFQDANFSYRLPAATLRRTPFKSLTITAYVQNLGILWRANREGIDPDYRQGPLPKSYALGININL